MLLGIMLPSVHTANFSGVWKNDVLNYGRIRLSPSDIEEFEEKKFRLAESKTLEISDIFNTLRTIHIPNMLSLFTGEDLDKAIKKAKEIVYRTFLQVSDRFNTTFSNHFDLGEEKVLIPTFTNFQNKTTGIGIHTEGGQCVKKLQVLTYMPSKIQSELTLYNLFNPNQGKCDNRNLNAMQNRLESVTLEDLSNLSAVFMVDGESGTAHSSQVKPQKINESENPERIIWTIIINKVSKSTIAELIPNFQNWLEEDILRFTRGEKREKNTITEVLSGHTL